ncbi:MAG: hypothetical protein NTW07_01995, partial [candidate division Zixibacteria bacterium]|nr:hypothetical protein [candidate division Zixibacteria bacterium]
MQKSMLGAVLLFVVVGTGSVSFARTYRGLITVHNQGNIQTTVAPGEWGLSDPLGIGFPYIDPITNGSIYGAVYPRGTQNVYLDGAIDIVGLSGQDTVGLGYQLWTNPLVFDSSWDIKSTDILSKYYSPEAYSELDIECIFHDTAAFDVDPSWSERLHEPLE